jgi:hypothetical protein
VAVDVGVITWGALDVAGLAGAQAKKAETASQRRANQEL